MHVDELNVQITNLKDLLMEKNPLSKCSFDFIESKMVSKQFVTSFSSIETFHLFLKKSEIPSENLYTVSNIILNYYNISENDFDSKKIDLKKLNEKDFYLNPKNISLAQIDINKDNSDLFYRYSNKYSLNIEAKTFIDLKRLCSKEIPNFIVDKSEIIELIDFETNPYNCFISPNGFGKTFTATMICAYYDYFYSDVSSILFNNINIYHQLYNTKNLKKYFIFEILFENFNFLNYNDFLNLFISKLNQSAINFFEKYFNKNLLTDFQEDLNQKIQNFNLHSYKNELVINNFIPTFIEFCNKIINLKNQKSIQLLIYIDNIQEIYNFQAKILDQLIQKSLNSLIVNFFFSFTKNTQSNEKYLNPYLLMIGSLPFPKNIYNQISDIISFYDLDDPIISYFIGFNSLDIQNIFKSFNIPENTRKILKSSYSYKFCDFESLKEKIPFSSKENIKIYHPLSIINSIFNGILNHTFMKISKNTFKTLFTFLNKDIKLNNTICELISGKRLKGNCIKRKTYYSLDQFSSVNNKIELLNFLLHNGFLSHINHYYILPNKEISNFLIKKYKTYISKYENIDKLNLQLDFFFEKEKFDQYFSNLINSFQSLKIYPSLEENSYHGFIYIYLLITLTNFQIFNNASIKYSNYFFQQSSHFSIIDLFIKTNKNLFLMLKFSKEGKFNFSTSSDRKDPFRDFNKIELDEDLRNLMNESIFCFINLNQNGPQIKLFDPIKSRDFGSLFINTSSKIINFCDFTLNNKYKIEWIRVNSQEEISNNIYKNINFSSFVIVENMNQINEIDSISNWKQVNGFCDKNFTNNFLNNLPKNFICSEIVVRELKSPETDLIYFLEPPKNLNLFSIILKNFNQKKIIFYQEKGIKQKEKILAKFFE